MSDRHDYLALDWVRGEIQETLNQAQQALEAFVDNPNDSTRMRFCQTHLHQVCGTLQMVEFYGAALLAEEMEKLARALVDQRVGNVADSQETLMRAILQLPPYLDRVSDIQSDAKFILIVEKDAAFMRLAAREGLHAVSLRGVAAEAGAEEDG